MQDVNSAKRLPQHALRPQQTGEQQPKTNAPPPLQNAKQQKTARLLLSPTLALKCPQNPMLQKPLQKNAEPPRQQTVNANYRSVSKQQRNADKKQRKHGKPQ